MRLFFLLFSFSRKKKEASLKWKFSIMEKRPFFAKKLKEVKCIFKNKRTEIEFQRYNLGNKY